MGNAVCLMTLCIIFIQNTQRTDVFRLLIDKQRVAQILLLMEIGQNTLRIVSHTGDVNPYFGKSRSVRFQLDQLVFTEGSPVCRSIQEQEQALLT